MRFFHTDVNTQISKIRSIKVSNFLKESIVNSWIYLNTVLSNNLLCSRWPKWILWHPNCTIIQNYFRILKFFHLRLSFGSIQLASLGNFFLFIDGGRWMTQFCLSMVLVLPLAKMLIPLLISHFVQFVSNKALLFVGFWHL